MPCISSCYIQNRFVSTFSLLPLYHLYHAIAAGKVNTVHALIVIYFQEHISLSIMLTIKVSHEILFYISFHQDDQL